VGKLEEESSQAIFVEADSLGSASERARCDAIAGRMVSDQIGELHRCGNAFRFRRMVALDRGRNWSRQAPAPNEDRADQRVVDPELAALAAQPLLWSVLGLGAHPELGTVEVSEHEPADIVHERSYCEFVSLFDARHLCDAIGGVAGGCGMPAEALEAL